MIRRRALRSIAVAASALLAPHAAGGAVLAAEAKNYAYLYLQGTIGDPAGNRPLAGATVRLTAGERVFEAPTDGRGTFVFERLPVSTYEMEVRSAEGRVIRSILKVRDGPDRTSLEVRFGYGAPIRPRIEPSDRRLEVTVATPRVRWKGFWKQLVIFAGAAGVMAL